MKKAIVPLILLSVIAAAVYSFSRPRGSERVADNNTPQARQPANPKPGSPSTGGSVANPIPIGRESLADREETDDSESLPQVKPASEIYPSADAAMEAILKGSKDYDDSILEQFTLPGPDCSWCPAFYESVREKTSDPSTPQEQRAYMAEILAISGRLENVQALVDSIKSARTNEDADLYAEAVELALGNEDVVRFLGDQMVSPNDTLREASVAAITNQGTVQAVELLNNHIRERGDPDGYYASGIGPGEMILDEDSLPAVQPLINQRDSYSHLWVKSALNSGMPGLMMVFNELESSQNPEADRALLKDAMEHVNLEDGLQEYVDSVIERNRSPVAVEFAQKIKEEFSQQENEAADSGS